MSNYTKFTNVSGDNLIVIPDTSTATEGDVLTYTNNEITWASAGDVGGDFPSIDLKENYYVTLDKNYIKKAEHTQTSPAIEETISIDNFAWNGKNTYQDNYLKITFNNPVSNYTSIKLTITEYVSGQGAVLREKELIGKNVGDTITSWGSDKVTIKEIGTDYITLELTAASSGYTVTFNVAGITTDPENISSYVIGTTDQNCNNNTIVAGSHIEGFSNVNCSAHYGSHIEGSGNSGCFVKWGSKIYGCDCTGNSATGGSIIGGVRVSANTAGAGALIIGDTNSSCKSTDGSIIAGHDIINTSASVGSTILGLWHDTCSATYGSFIEGISHSGNSIERGVHIEGSNNKDNTLAHGSHIEGAGNNGTYGGACHIEGRSNSNNIMTAGHIEGVENSSNTLTGGGHIEGKNITGCTAYEGHIEGYGHFDCRADHSHIEGYQNSSCTISQGTHIEGKFNSGCTAHYGSHIEGIYNITPSTTTGVSAIHVGGGYNAATNDFETVIGKYCNYSSISANKPLLVVGNGTTDAERSNAVVVYENGGLLVAGNITANGTPIISLPSTQTASSGDVLTFDGTTIGWASAQGGGGSTGTTYSAGTDLKIENDVISINTNGTANSADMSFVAGSSTSAIGTGAAAFGIKTTATGDGSFAQGKKTSARNTSHAEGYGTKADGGYAHAEGYNTSASGYCSHTEGGYTFTSGSYCHAEGYYTSAVNDTYSDYGHYSHAEGYSAIASGDAHAEGYKTSAIKQYSHAEGMSTLASGEGAHAEGNGTKAFGVGSHAEGWTTTANGRYSHTNGLNTIANTDYSFVVGQYNLPGTTALFVVGNGSGPNNKSDAFIVQSNGLASATNLATSGFTDVDAALSALSASISGIETILQSI